jgi:tetratricopeptide (TPR) repeat protein
MRTTLPFAMLTALLVGGCDSLHARMLAQEGVNLYHKGMLGEAAARFEEAEKLDPYIPAIQLDLGFSNLALYQGDPKGKLGEAASQKAVVAFEKYLQLRPGEERARVFLIQTFIDTGRYDDAVAYFKPAVEKTPIDLEALTTLGIIASKSGKYEEAKGWYEKRIEKDPSNADARLAVAVLMWDYLHNHTDLAPPDRISLSDVAIAHLAEAIKLKPAAPAAYTYTNLLYRERALGETNDDGKRKDLEQASKFFQKAQELQKGAK